MKRPHQPVQHRKLSSKILVQRRTLLGVMPVMTMRRGQHHPQGPQAEAGVGMKQDRLPAENPHKHQQRRIGNDHGQRHNDTPKIHIFNIPA